MDFRKVDDYTLEATKTVTETKVNTYDYDFLLRQRDAIQAQKDEQMKARDAELKEVNELIVECEKRGITKRPVEDINGRPEEMPR
jgi:hypothetical protein